ncbi:MAG: type 1 glutamine amidotransferase [Candidatus Omnitrophica bacterium]|nr:type 1 glutamine amidotransferase [Candidatus Omnitrophota bacterium]
MILFIKHVDIEGPETLGAFFVKQGFELAVIDLHRGQKLSANLDGIDAVVSLGGPMNVYEEAEHPFLKDEDIFLKKVLRSNIPFLGICLGAQLLAKASGGKVVRSPKPEIGWFNVDLTADGLRDPLFKGLPMTMEVYQWHGDMAVIPAGGVHLASSQACPVQAFRVGRNAYGLQFHAEITDKSIDEWSQDYAPEKQGERQVMQARYKVVEKDFVRYGEMLCRNFLTVMQSDKL